MRGYGREMRTGGAKLACGGMVGWGEDERRERCGRSEVESVLVRSVVVGLEGAKKTCHLFVAKSSQTSLHGTWH